MKFVLDTIGAQGFAIVSDTKAGKLTTALGPSEGVTGFIDVVAGQTHIKAKSEMFLSVANVVVPHAEGATTLEGLVHCAKPDVDLRIGSEGMRGRATIPSATAERLQVKTPAMDGLDMDDLRLVDIGLEAGPLITRVTLGRVRASSVSVPSPRGAVQLLDIALEGVDLILTHDGGWQATIAHVTVKTLHGPTGNADVGIEGLRLEGVEVSNTGKLSIVRAAAGRTRLRTTHLTTNSESDTQKRSIDLALLSLVSGFVHADVVTDVNLPIFGSRRANHPIRVDVVDGRIQYVRLERGLATLEDIVLHLRLEDERLCLYKDIPLVPFDRTDLVTWALPGDELDFAQRGWVNVARLAVPRVEIETNPDGVDKGAKFLTEISASKIDIDVRIEAHSGWRLDNGALLRLGVPDENIPAIESLRVTGNVTYRPDETNDPGAIEFELSTIRTGVSELAVGAQSLAADIRVDASKGRLRMNDVQPASLELDIEGIQLTQLLLQPSSLPTNASLPAQRATA